MDRRTFLATGVAAGAAASLKIASTAQAQESAMPGKHDFKLKYAPHFGMFKHHAGEDPLDQLKFMADVGFTALEDNQMTRRPVELQEKIGREMERLGMTMGVFVANFGTAFEKHSFVNGDKAMLDNFLADLRNSVEVARRVNAKWMTIVLGTYNPKLEWGYQTANAIEMLRRGAEICEPHGLVMVMEPLNPWANHPGLFLTKIPQAYEICKAVNSPAVKILDDLYHQQITEGNLIPNIDKAWEEIAYFQTGDNPGRQEPTTGEINYKNVFRHIHAKGFTGVIGMEHGISRKGKEGEQALIKAYAECDSFEPKQA